jgi:hypothetical protein
MGISMLIQKNRMLRNLLQLMGVLAQSDPLLAEFLKVADLGKVVKMLFQLSDIDMSKIALGERERLLQQFQNQMQPAMERAQGAGPAAPGAAQQVQQAAQNLGVAR